MKLLTFEKYFRDSLQDPNFKQLWQDAQPEYQLSRQIIKKRLDKKLTQSQLAKKIGTSQAIISKIENSTFNPSLSLLKRISEGLGSKITLEI